MLSSTISDQEMKELVQKELEVRSDPITKYLFNTMGKMEFSLSL